MKESKGRVPLPWCLIPIVRRRRDPQAKARAPVAVAPARRVADHLRSFSTASARSGHWASVCLLSGVKRTEINSPQNVRP